MTATDYAIRRMTRRGVTMSHVAEALASEESRETQPDGRLRIWGWSNGHGHCLRVIIEADGETLVNAFPDEKCTKRIRKTK